MYANKRWIICHRIFTWKSIQVGWKFEKKIFFDVKNRQLTRICNVGITALNHCRYSRKTRYKNGVTKQLFSITNNQNAWLCQYNWMLSIDTYHWRGMSFSDLIYCLCILKTVEQPNAIFQSKPIILFFFPKQQMAAKSKSKIE